MAFLKQNWFQLAIAIPVVVGAAAVTYYFAYALPKYDSQHAADEQTIANLQAQLVAASNTPPVVQTVYKTVTASAAPVNQTTPPQQNDLAQKSQCASDAAAFFNSGRYTFSSTAINPTYTSHYDVAQDQCVIEILFQTSTTYNDEAYDAIEGYLDGEFIAPISSSGLPSFDSPVTCIVSPPSNSAIIQCSSLGKYTNLINQYWGI